MFPAVVGVKTTVNTPLFNDATLDGIPVFDAPPKSKLAFEETHNDLLNTMHQDQCLPMESELF